MAHNRHVYHLIAPKTEDLYIISARAAGKINNIRSSRVRRLTRDEALSKARSTPSSFDLKVSPCRCGADGLSSYAEENPRSLIAERMIDNEEEEA
jgi:hypothetical protein